MCFAILQDRDGVQPRTHGRGAKDWPHKTSDGAEESPLREVPGRMVMIWDGAPIHRSHPIKEFLANGASPRLHLEPLPAYAPELNPDEGLWQQLKGVKPRLIHSVFRGATLEVFMR
jgi:hypothetical protein